MMDLNSLSRPAILSQCSRCSSSLAVLENEWATLSTAYAIATAWLSVNFNRISVSPERKQIPQTPDFHLLRGRTTQEVTCKLCQQKLGALCTLDNGPNIFWKMSRVAFREVVTMRTAEPIFKDGALERFLRPNPPEPVRRDRTSVHEAALVPTGTSGLSKDPVLQRQMQHQGRSIDQISSSVNHLQDTMTDLKHSFTSLRIELQGPSRHISENGSLNSQEFDMVATVLKELKSKSDEIEKLKLEIEALKLRNRFIQERRSSNPDYLSPRNDSLPEVQSPGLLQAGRKRAWPDAFSNGRSRTVADSFGEEDMIDDMSMETPPSYLVSLPIKDSHRITNGEIQDQSTSGFSYVHDGDHEQHSRTAIDNQGPAFSQQSPTKRLRVTQSSIDLSRPQYNSEKKRPGRPRKSVTQISNTSPEGSEAAVSSSSVQVPTALSSPQKQPIRGRPRRTTRSRSMGPIEPNHTAPTDPEAPIQKAMEESANGESVVSKDGVTNSDGGGASVEDSAAIAEEKRKAKVAARDAMTRMAMQREELMETEESR
ncbi:uncharacterized protein N7484_005215 [Penicillium longicatenatum]|uniref:uncharacterized protein n=1 Tax=Penicillium longicatenatum TaxID=1561947 RepID=UPI00254748BF|nr:uncharacterized protein N7484_005215 [Penicillium longicatenatum]KAJ5651492.1 hypothetical protein N7484_005215 [Penicillium longicatenatum]